MRGRGLADGPGGASSSYMTSTILNHVGELGRGPLALIPARTSLAATMLYHGIDKLREGGREGSAQFFDSLGLRPGSRWSMVTALAEIFAGASMMLGVLTRPAALTVLVTQSVAIGKVHAPKGFANTKGGFEFNLALMAVALGVLVAGPGPVSLRTVADRRPSGLRRLFRRRRRSTLGRLLAILG